MRAERQQWPEGLAAFQHATQCFELSVATRRKAIADLSATPSSAQANARQIASHERAIVEAEMRRAEAARGVASIQRRITSISR